MQTLDVVWKTSREKCMKGTFEEKETELGKSVLSARLDDDDDGVYVVISF